MQTIRKRFAGVTAVMLAAIALTSCAVGSSEENTQAQPSSVALWDELWLRAHGVNRHSTHDEVRRRAVDNHDRLQELIAACMADHGWEFLPVERDRRGDIPMATSEFGSEEFASTYGFGITTREWHTQEPYDPNLARVANLSDSERERWDEAFWGPDTSRGWREGGCFPTAHAAVFGGLDAEPDRFAELETDIQRISQAVASHPDTRRLRSEWGSCMADKGFRDVYPNPEYAQNHVSLHWNQLLDEILNSPECTWWDGGHFDGRHIDTDDPACHPTADQRSEFTAWEIDVAVADHQCRDALGFDETVQTIWSGLVSELVSVRRAELEEWAAYREDRRTS